MAGNENSFPKKPGKPHAPLNPWEIAQPIDEEPEPMILADSGDDSIDFGAVSNVHEGASGIIPLADLPDPTSSASIISWAEVIRQQKESILDDNQDSGLKVDSVSDKDLRRHMPGINSFFIPEPSPTQSIPHAVGPVRVPEAFGADDMGSMFFDDHDDVKTMPTEVFSDPQAEVRTVPTAVPPLTASPPASGIFGVVHGRPGEHGAPSSAISFDVAQTPRMPKAVPEVYATEMVEAEVLDPPTADDIFLPNAEDITDSDFYPEARTVDGSSAGAPPSGTDMHGLLFASRDDDESTGRSEVRLDGPAATAGDPDDDHSSVMDILLGDAPPTSGRGRSENSDDASVDFGQPGGNSFDNSNVLISGRNTSPTQPMIDLSIFEQAPMPMDEVALDSGELMSNYGDRVLPPTLFNSLTSTSNLDLPEFESPIDTYNPEELVDLYHEGPPSKGISDSGSLQVSQEELDAAYRRQRLMESSAIDLASHPSLGGMEMDLPPAPTQPDSGNIEMGVFRQHPSPMEDIFAQDDDNGGIDLSTMAPADRAESQMLDKDQYDEILLPYSAPAAPAAPAVRGRTPTPVPGSDPLFHSDPWSTTPMLPSGSDAAGVVGGDVIPSEVPHHFGMVRGGILGGLLTAGTFAAIYLSGAIPNADIPAIDPAKGDLSVVAKAVVAPVAPATPGIAADARTLLSMGEPEKALEALAKVENPTPVELSSRGQARWLSYLQTAAAGNAPMNASAEAIVKAKTDLASAAEKAKALGTDEGAMSAAQSILWQGLIEESLGNFDAASKLYSTATLSGDAAAVLKAAQNRLRLMAPATGMPVSRMDPRDALLGVTVLLQADTPVKADTLSEAGFRFWDALALASSHDYAKAQSKLKEARKLHDAARLKKPGRGLNPLSDPLDQIFLRCCDDIAAYWVLQDNIYRQPGMPQVVAKDGFKGGLDELLSRSANLSATLKSTQELLAAEKLDPADVAKAVRRLIDDRRATEDASRAAVELLKTEGFRDAKLESAVGKLALARKTADDRLRAVALALKDAGGDDADAPKAIASLARAKADLDGTLKAVADRLKEKKLLASDGTSAQMIESLTALLNKPATPVVGGNVDTLLPPAQLLVGGGMGATATLMGISKRVVELAKEAADEKSKADAAGKVAVAERAKSEMLLKAQLDEAEKVRVALANAARDRKAREEAVAAKKAVEAELAKAREAAEAELAKAKVAAETAMVKLTEELTAMKKKSADDSTALKTEGDKVRKEMLAGITAMEVRLKTAQTELGDIKVREAKFRDEAEARTAAARSSEDKYKAESAKMNAEIAGLKKQYDVAVKALSERPATAVVAAAPTAASEAADMERGQRLFARGLQAYYRGEYASSETDLREAIRSNGGDARYHYILGLVCWYQNRLDDSKGALIIARSLEVRGMPSRSDISTTLERIQGTPRTVLNLYRP